MYFENQGDLRHVFYIFCTYDLGLCINPDTKRPYPTSIIEKGLKDIHFSVKPNRNSKQQALEVIPLLKEVMKIERAQMRVRISLNGNACKNVAEKADKMGTVEQKEFTGNALSMVSNVGYGFTDFYIKTLSDCSSCFTDNFVRSRSLQRLGRFGTSGNERERHFRSVIS